jgi:hypothetical protein
VRADRASDAGGAGDPAECPGGAGAVHPPPGAGSQDRAGGASVDGFADGAQHRDGQRDVGRLGTFAEHVQQLVPGFVPQVGDVGPASFGHPQAEHPEQADQHVIVRTGGQRRARRR